MKKSKLYKDANGEWRWETKSRGRIIGASTEGYKNRKGALANYRSLIGASRIPLYELNAAGKPVQVW